MALCFTSWAKEMHEQHSLHNLALEEFEKKWLEIQTFACKCMFTNLSTVRNPQICSETVLFWGVKSPFDLHSISMLPRRQRYCDLQLLTWWHPESCYSISFLRSSVICPNGQSLGLTFLSDLLSVQSVDLRTDLIQPILTFTCSEDLMSCQSFCLNTHLWLCTQCYEQSLC